MQYLYLAPKKGYLVVSGTCKILNLIFLPKVSEVNQLIRRLFYFFRFFSIYFLFASGQFIQKQFNNPGMVVFVLISVGCFSVLFPNTV